MGSGPVPNTLLTKSAGFSCGSGGGAATGTDTAGIIG